MHRGHAFSNMKCFFPGENVQVRRPVPAQYLACRVVGGLALLSTSVTATVMEPQTLSPCNVPEDGVSWGAHVPVCPGHDVRAGPGRARRLRRAQDRTGGAALRPGEVRDGVCARPGPD